MTGRSGRFEAGHEPANKGKTCPPGVGGRSAAARATQFKRGSRTGRASLQYKPIGTEIVRSDGYLQRKVNDDLPHYGRWRMVHVIRWEEANGPVPEGHCLKCLDGDKTNTDPTNWKAIHRGVLSRLNGSPHKKRVSYAEADPALRPTLIALAEVEQQIHFRKRGDRRKDVAA